MEWSREEAEWRVEKLVRKEVGSREEMGVIVDENVEVQ